MPWLAENRNRLDAFRRGDPAALAETYRVYAPEVARLLTGGFVVASGERHHRFHGFRTPFDLDDALQQTFMRAFSEAARNRYDGLRPFRSYLRTIARNVVIDRLRTLAAEKKYFSPADSPNEGEVPADAVGEASPEQAVLNQQIRSLYERFKASLGEGDRRLLVMRFEQRATRVAVSAATGLSAMQIRTAEQRLRRALAAALAGSGYEPDATWAILVIAAIGLRGAS